MTDEVISLRVGRELKEKMRMHQHINWSAIVRRALIQEIDKMHRIDRMKALNALKNAEKIMKSGIFDSDKTGAQIIREWRDKRR